LVVGVAGAFHTYGNVNKPNEARARQNRPPQCIAVARQWHSSDQNCEG